MNGVRKRVGAEVDTGLADVVATTVYSDPALKCIIIIINYDETETYRSWSTNTDSTLTPVETLLAGARFVYTVLSVVLSSHPSSSPFGW